MRMRKNDTQPAEQIAETKAASEAVPTNCNGLFNRNLPPLEYLESDRRKMEEYVASRIPEEGCRIVLADGPEGEFCADLVPVPFPDGELGLHWETNCPEAIDLKDIYQRFKMQERTWEEWHRELQGDMARWRVADLETEVTALRQARADIATAAKEAIDRAVLNSDVVDHEAEEMTTERPEQPPYQFQLCDDYWIVRFTTESGTEEAHLRDLKGYRHVAKLLARPDKGIKAIELQGLQDSPVADQTMTPQFASTRESRQAVEKRLADLEQEMAQAADPAEIIELKEEHERLSQIAQDSKKRRLGPPSPRERARKAVTNVITRAKGRIRETMPEFAIFLDRSILAHGTAFAYSPAPPAPTWVL